MTFKPGNEHIAKKTIKRPLDSQPTCVKLYEGHKEALKGVDGWQNKVRDFVESLINCSV